MVDVRPLMEHLSDMTASTSFAVMLPESSDAGPAPSSPEAAAILGSLGFVVRLEAFSGPLDLLLHLLREEQIDIADIPIARIADQFLTAIKHLGLNPAAEYLEMASRLVRLKVQMLLPRNQDGEEWEDPRAELVRRLLEYQQIREIAHWMAAAADRRALRFARGYLPPPPELPSLPLTLDLLDLLTAVERVVASILHPVFHSVVARPLNLEGALVRVEALLAERDEFIWTEALGPRPTITDVLSLLIALLELARRGKCSMTQPAVFAPLVIRRESSRSAD
jgi:segregation and condensation protein A